MLNIPWYNPDSQKQLGWLVTVFNYPVQATSLNCFFFADLLCPVPPSIVLNSLSVAWSIASHTALPSLLSISSSYTCCRNTAYNWYNMHWVPFCTSGITGIILNIGCLSISDHFDSDTNRQWFCPSSDKSNTTITNKRRLLGSSMLGQLTGLKGLSSQALKSQYDSASVTRLGNPFKTLTTLCDAFPMVFIGSCSKWAEEEAINVNPLRP